LTDLKTTVKRRLSKLPWLDRWIRLYLLRRRARTTAYPRWAAIPGVDGRQWREAREAARGGPRVLLATNVGGYSGGATLESLIGAALTLRGAEVEVLLCDHALPACLQCEVGIYPRLQYFERHGPSRDLCHHCHEPAAAMFAALGLPMLRFSDFLTPHAKERAHALAGSMPVDAIPTCVVDGVAVGEHALAGALRFFARANLDAEPFGEAVLRRYFEAALLTAEAVGALLTGRRYTAAVFHHGIYVPQGPTGEVCRRRGVRVVNWNPAYRKRCFIFSHGDTYHHTLMTEDIDTWQHLPWTAAMEAQILDYLKSRWQGTQDWIWFHERPQLDLGSISAETGLDFTKPTIGMLTNVMWDAQLHYPANAFRDMKEWTLETIAYFERRPELQLVIRAHPAEIRGTLPSRQPIVAEIRAAFPHLPPNVFLIPPESRVSTYAIMDKCDAVVIYGTKTGVELTSMGIPVIVAGEAWIRNKGLTQDAKSADDYFRLLDSLPLRQRMDDATIRRSRMYAYHFFFRRMIPVEYMAPAVGNPPFRLDLRSLEDLAPGRSAGLDIICSGILSGAEFIYPAELIAAGAPA